jgi:hypothetical protein
LFSRENVAAYINNAFEPAWESVRPVPTVTIDFGNGIVLTRTLHGNIASYVCNADGKVLDVIPGIYTPDVYVQRLNELSLLANYLRVRTPEVGGQFLKEYHAKQAAGTHRAMAVARLDVGKSKGVEGSVIALVAVAAEQPAPAAPAPAPAVAARRDEGKRIVERPLKAVVAAAPAAAPARPVDITKPTLERAVKGVVAAPPSQPIGAWLTLPEDLASWNLLREDTQANEAVRRRQIHELLAKSGLVSPAEITKPIYKDVLHADLDDPYMGLGPTLFGTYPFTREEKAH